MGGRGVKEEGKRAGTSRKICAVLVAVHAIQKESNSNQAVCQNMTGCHIQAATHAETSTPMNPSTSSVTPPHLVAQLQTVERIRGVWVEGLREEVQGEGEVASQVGVPV